MAQDDRIGMTSKRKYKPIKESGMVQQIKPQPSRYPETVEKVRGWVDEATKPEIRTNKRTLQRKAKRGGGR